MPVEGGPGVRVVVGAVVDRVEQQRARAQAQVEAAVRVRERARREHEAAVALADRQARRRAALTAQAELETGRPEQEALAAELEAAVRAAELAAVLDAAVAREQARAAATTAEATARAGLAAAGLPVDLTSADLRAAAGRARERSGRLDALRDVASERLAEGEVVRAAEQEQQSCAERERRAREVLAELPGRRAAAGARAAAAREAERVLPEARAQLARLDEALVEARGLTGALARLDDLREQRLEARETAVALRAAETDVRTARLESMVAELADQLADDAPCVVCGSLDHPDPYEGVSEGVTREDEQRARQAADAADRRVAELDAQAAAATATEQAHRRRLAALDRPDGADGLAPERAAAQDALRALEARAADLVPALAEAEDVEAAQLAAEGDALRASTEGAAAARRHDDAQARAARLDARLAAELDGAPDLAAALRAAAHEAQACEAALAAAEHAVRAGEEAVRAAAAASAAAREAGFADPAAAGSARRPEAWRSEAVRARRAHDDRRAQVDGALADPELAVPLEPQADPAAARRALEQADAELEAAVGVQAAAAAREEQVALLAPRVVQAREALAPLQEHARTVRRLADLCAGGGANALKMSLTSFVLAARLEEVAGAASTRLRSMTQGRYTLVHTDGAARGGARSGLGLLVRDAWTGRDRDTATLSGGETFQASLALALGLADVVQAEAGGTRIEALFVDEGFGTLDEDTLEEVMDVLDALREGGRVVGLVSHVAELRSRIPAQVHVRKGRTGSTLALVGC